MSGGKVRDLPNDRQTQSVDKSNITIALFMDGTSNNSYNVDARKTYESEYKKDKQKAAYSDTARAYDTYTDHYEASYENDHTNVNKLYQMYIETTNQYKFYVEGPGSVYKDEEEVVFDRYDSDDMSDGTGFGRGKDGIRGKVFKACQKITSVCDISTRNIRFDVFGFSRGAAAARNFVYEIFRGDSIDINVPIGDVYNDRIDFISSLSEVKGPLIRNPKCSYEFSNASNSKRVGKHGFLGYLLKKKGRYNSNLKVTVRFIGLLDTVASYDPFAMLLGGKANIFPDFKKYGEYLNMNTCTKPLKAENIVHLTSQDEHRENFSLTPINNEARSTKPLIKEYCLPGVHSDVGGGYVDSAPEEKIVGKEFFGTKDLEKRKKELVNQRFFRETDLFIDDSFILKRIVKTHPLYIIYNLANDNELGVTNYLRSKRAKLCSRYDRIPLKIIMDQGNQYKIFSESLASRWIDLVEGNSGLIDLLRTQIHSQVRLLQLAYKNGNYNINNEIDNLLFKLSDPYEIAKLTMGDLFSEKKESDKGDSMKKIRSRQEYQKIERTEKKIDDDILVYARSVIENSIKRSPKYVATIFRFKTSADLTKIILKDIDQKENLATNPIDEILQQVVLRLLRYRCFHWSASYIGMVEPHKPNSDPTSNGKRHIYNYGIGQK